MIARFVASACPEGPPMTSSRACARTTAGAPIAPTATPAVANFKSALRDTFALITATFQNGAVARRRLISNRCANPNLMNAHPWSRAEEAEKCWNLSVRELRTQYPTTLAGEDFACGVRITVLKLMTNCSALFLFAWPNFCWSDLVAT